MYGLQKLVKDIKEFENEDPIFWKLSPLLEKLAKENKTFDSLN
jgi:3-hydroxyacyl-CoA dehydrogenase